MVTKSTKGGVHMSVILQERSVQEINEIIDDLETRIDEQYGATMVVWSHG